MGLIKAIINRINETDIRDEEKKIDNFNKEKYFYYYYYF